jgi:Ner family transcriptional regulator
MARNLTKWHAEKIKFEIRVKFGSLRAFAKTIGSSPQSVSGAILSPIKSARIELQITSNLGKKPFELWPDRWTPKGQKISRAEFRRQSITERATA